MLLDRFSDTFGTRTVLIVPDIFGHVRDTFMDVFGHVHGHVADMFEYYILKFFFMFFDAIVKFGKCDW